MMKKSIVLLLWILASLATAQNNNNITFPEASQKAMGMQRVGLTDITISYSSPLVKSRKIWSELVPYNEVWRCGANENTTISFTSEVLVEGKLLQAGTYGLHMIPMEKEWTIIFSRNSNSWGSYFYDKAEDALRVNVKPAQNNFQEWLSYQFTETAANSTVITLYWEKIKVPFKIDINVPEVVYRNMKNELRGLQGFSWEALAQAAKYCADNNIYPDEAMKWINQSINSMETFTNLRVKSKLFSMKGLKTESEELMRNGLNIANEQELNSYGYELMNQKKTDEAIDVFKNNVKRNPGSWNAYDSLAEALVTSGNNKDALLYYKIALSKAPDNQKTRINGVMRKLEEK